MAPARRRTVSALAATGLVIGALAVGFGGGWLTHRLTTTTTTTTTTSTSTTTTSTTSTTTTTVATIARCSGATLTGSQVSSEGAAGTIEVTYVVTNTSVARCQMDGYPDIQLLSSNDTDLQTTVVRGQTFTVAAANRPAAVVTLSVQGRASFMLSYSDVPTGTQTSCPQAASINVYPPASSTPLNIPSSIGPCSMGTVSVSPFYAAS